MIDLKNNFKRLPLSAKSIAGESLYQIQRIGVFNSLVRLYYHSALICMNAFIRIFGFSQIKAVFNRHQNWILGISDIDLIAIIGRMTPHEESVFFEKFHRFYVVYRLFFFVLCPYGEIRFLREDSIERHPSRYIKESELLYNFEQWIGIDDLNRDTSCAHRFIPKPAATGLFPLSSFLGFNLYGFFQDSLLSKHSASGISARTKKCFLRIAQHAYFINHNARISLETVEKEINSRESRVSCFGKFYPALKNFSLNHADNLAKSAEIIKDTILAVSCAYDAITPEDMAPLKPAHTESPFYTSRYFDGFLKKAEKMLGGGGMNLIYYKDPYKFYRTNVFIAIDETVSPDKLRALLGLCREHYDGLVREETILRFTTASLLTCQMYYLNGPIALESYFVSNRNIYDKGGSLNIVHPPDKWNAIKIRESAYAFKEFFLPLLMFFEKQGKATYELFDTPELNLLLAYFLFLKSKSEFIEALKGANGDPYDLSAYILSKYGAEIGADCWQAMTLRDCFPHISRMIDMVDDAAWEAGLKK